VTTIPYPAPAEAEAAAASWITTALVCLPPSWSLYSTTPTKQGQYNSAHNCD